MKLDIEGVRLSDSENQLNKGSYKPIPEYPVIGTPVKNSNMVREKVDTVEDGADDPMLGSEDKHQLAKKEEVKFISAGDHKNGDAKIDIGEVDKGFTGMTKEELLKFANDPFWVRLRWIFFILFWALWIAMLVGAIMIIIGAPKCAAPTPLSWYKQGPLVMKSDKDHSTSEYKSTNAKGVIYELNPTETYLVHTDNIKEKIRKIVEQFKIENVNVIVDLTPNFVDKNDELFKKALQNEEYRSAFTWYDGAVAPTNWLAKAGGSAWNEIEPKKFVLSQFGKELYDLQLNDSNAKKKFKDVLSQLIELGVKGFRLSNAKHFIVSKVLKDEQIIGSESIHTDYEFWTHTYTTFQSGLGDLLNEFSLFVKNATNNEGFISVTDDIERPEAFYITNTTRLGIELPIFGVFPHTLTVNAPNVSRLFNELTQIRSEFHNGNWPQWNYHKSLLIDSNIEMSEYHAFIMLLPGVPVAQLEYFTADNMTSYWNKLEEIRLSPSCMHGSFDVYTNSNYSVIAYTRFKSGNPGYFVAYNPTDELVIANFTSISNMPDQLTVNLLSKNYNETNIVERAKVQTAAIPISKKSVIILTFVPNSTE